MLHDLVRTRHQEIVDRAAVKVALRRAPRATERELEHGVSLFLAQLSEYLRRAGAGPSREMDETATAHGGELLHMGFSIAQVVHGYGDVCQVVMELADELNLVIAADDFRLLNLALDDAIAAAVTEYARLREESWSSKSTRDVGELSHEMRNFLNSAGMAFDLMREGQVSPRGSTASVLKRSLDGMRQLVDRSLAEVRLQAQLYDPQPLQVCELIEQVELSAAIDAKARDLQLSVPTVDGDIDVLADRALLASAVANLVQNALKFTRAGGLVTIRATASDERVSIEVEDECGGLPSHKVEDLFREFEQYGADRSGVGLGLSISKRAVEANGGTLSVRNFPGKGCVFTIELARLQRDRETVRLPATDKAS